MSPPGPTREPGESAFWRLALVVFVDKAPKPLMQLMRRRMPSFPIEELEVVGRRTGRARRIFVALFVRDGVWYVGHPGRSASWVSNLVAAGGGTLLRRGHPPVRVIAEELSRGPERDAAIAMTETLPNPIGFVYRRARRHVRAVGRYFRLVPAEPETAP